LRFLIDNALPPRLADLLLTEGHDAVHVRAYGMHAAKDEAILARALEEDRIVVSADSDFGTILAAQEAERPSFILFRETNLLVARDYI
jgi:predicted nuclease of predicted toxin-antitoxin system